MGLQRFVGGAVLGDGRWKENDLGVPDHVDGTNTPQNGSVTSLTRCLRLASIGSFAHHVLAAGADPNGGHPRRCEHTNVRVGDEPLAVATVRHGRRSIHSRTQTYGR